MRYNVTIAGESFAGDYSGPSGAAAAAALSYEGRHGRQPDSLTAEVTGDGGAVKFAVRRAADNGNVFDVKALS